MDFYKLKTKRTKEGLLVYPDFVVQSSKDILVKGKAFYAVWDKDKGLWSRDEMDVARMVDIDLKDAADKLDAVPLLMSSYESKTWTQYKQYISSLDDTNVDLDISLNFADDPPDRKKNASRRLPYSLVDAPCPAWEEIVGTLYDPENRQKIEWAIGSIISGESKENQKFLVFYGKPGSGKSTIMKIVEKLFEGYTVPFDAKALTTSSNAFSMAAFKHNPLVAIQHDGDLSKIEDNTRLNSIVSHEIMAINEKFKAEFYSRAIAFLFLGTNEPVKITGSKSGILRRLIDVHPSGLQIPNKHYHALLGQIDFELGGIAQHCLGVYYSLGKNYYSNYAPTAMMYETDVFYNFVESAFDLFYTQDGVTLDRAWQLYKEFCEDALIRSRLARHQFRAELMSYFNKFDDELVVDGVKLRSYYSEFKTLRFMKVDDSKPIALTLDNTTSLLDEVLAEMPAQYATSSGTPKYKWDDISTVLKDLDTTKMHYVQVPEKHIVIDFDLKDEHGKKSLERNLEEAASWPVTYTEYSQGGGGVHLHYIYDGPGDVADLKPLHKEGVEVKTLTGNASLRRRLTRCNGVPIATITSGLELKEKPVHDSKVMKSEKAIRKLIAENLMKEHAPGTRPSVNFIKKILDEAYESGIAYDVSDMYADVYSFAMDSTNHARECVRAVAEMKFMSEEMELQTEADNDRLVFYDVEVFPNLLIICWKFAGADSSVVTMINPSPDEVTALLKMKLVGFNCRRYDNHILYARSIGRSIAQIYELSQAIVEHNDRSAMFGVAYDLSYTDIYDFSSVKQSLKKFEIDLGLHHLELGLPWDQPVPEEMWVKVSEYCANDVIATEATFEARKGDWIAREILSSLSGLNVNQSTQSHTARILFGSERKPQKEFLYTDLSKMFEGYVYDFGKSTYRGEEVGEGGYVYAEKGSYSNVALIDVASMHPSSIELLDLFGPYTKNYSDLKEARIAIKRGDLAGARRLLDGKLAPFLEDESQAEDLSYALKIALNIVYGLTSARFENPFRDPRNKDNIVAKRGALFMIDLKHAVQEQGFKVAHIKTDSIKIPDATPEIIQFVMEFGQKYGYDFEHEATYEEFVLFNDAVYIAKNTPEAIAKAEAKGKKKPLWEAVGAQFQHPYVYKTILSGEEPSFEDMCETKNVQGSNMFLVHHDPEGNETLRQFVGRIGRFVPMKPGGGAAQLIRVKEDKEHAVTGTKGYLWMEAEEVKRQGLESRVDRRYHDAMVHKALEAMEQLGYQ